MTEYNVTLRVSSEANLARLIQAVPMATVVSLSPVVEKKPRKMRYVNNRRNKGISGNELIEKLFRARRVRTTTELTKEFISAGFSQNSMSPRLAALTASGKVGRIAEGKYAWLRPKAL